MQGRKFQIDQYDLEILITVKEINEQSHKLKGILDEWSKNEKINIMKCCARDLREFSDKFQAYGRIIEYTDFNIY